MPDARLDADGTWRFGVSDADPYFSVWSSVSLFPRLELSGRYVTIEGVPGFPDNPERGDYRDKAFDAKALLLAESAWAPALAVGAQDYLGTRLFHAKYLALTKRVGEFDITAGYGEGRIEGAFGGVRYVPGWLPGWNFIAEYDANNYAGDHGAGLSGAAARKGGATYGVGYAGSWWGAQVSYQDGDPAANAYISIPLMGREFVPKIHEPAPYTTVTPQAPFLEWAADRRYARALGEALDRQGFGDVHVRAQAGSLDVVVTHNRISMVSRAVGRAARTAVRLGPRDLQLLRVTYTANEQPLLTYEFRDVALLDRYFSGRATRAELDRTISVVYASSAIARDLHHAVAMPLDDREEDVLGNDLDRFLAVGSNARSDFALLPFNLRIFFNDPGQPVRYDTFSVVTYDRRLDRGLYLNGAVRLTLFENVSDIRQPSTSLLPHVRSDIGEYRREGDRLRLESLLLNKYLLLAERWYGRLSAGYYEEMFAGGGGQLLYVPSASDWAVDLAVDALRQRAPGEAFGFRDYRTVTALTSFHYRFPSYGVTATTRVGRFLARDEGVRFELKRRFRSGVELGGWYGWTNEKDITTPGSPDDPYRDKGVFVSIPLNALLTRDTQERASMALADYTRDVSQTVTSPTDLYRLLELSLNLNDGERNTLSGFAD